jgi:site-specific recombinase XerD
MAGACALSQQESNDLIAALKSDRDRLLVLSGQHLGLRISELLSLKIGMVANGAVPKDTIMVPRRSLKGGKARRRGLHGRSIPVHSDLASAIAFYLATMSAKSMSDPTCFLFPSRKGINRPMGARHAWRIIKTAARAAGLETDRISTHSLRKTFAAEVYGASGHDLRACQVCLGHTDIGTTIKYIEPDAQRMADLVRNLPSRIASGAPRAPAAQAS